MALEVLRDEFSDESGGLDVGSSFDPGESAAPEAPDYSGYLTGLYRELFNRAPDPSGYNFWLDALNSGNYSPDFVRQQFLSSPEYLSAQAPAPAPAPAPAFDNRQFLTGLYEQVLRRAPDEGGLNFWLDALNQGYSPEDVERQFYSSPEYQQLINPPAPAPAPAPAASPAPVGALEQAEATSDIYGGVELGLPSPAPAPAPVSAPAPAPAPPAVTESPLSTLSRTVEEDVSEPLPLTAGALTQAAATTTPSTTETSAKAEPKDEWERYLDYVVDYETGQETYKPDTSTYIPADFNWKTYLEKNPDLGAAGIDTEAEAIRHYRVHGRSEGRQGGGTAPFTPQEAMALALKNPNARNFGQFTVSPVSQASMYGGSTDIPAHLLDYTPLSYEVSGLKGKTDKGVNYEAILNYDTSGKLAGYQIDYKTGSDSGTVVTYDAAGNATGSDSYDHSESWRRPVALGLAMIGAAYGVPQLGALLSGGALAAGSTGAALLGGAALGGATSAVSGAEGSDILKGAALGAAGAGAGALAGDVASSLNTSLGTAGTTTGQAITGALQAGAQALPQAISTGDFSNVFKQAVLGGVTSAAGDVLSSTLSESGFTPGQIKGAITLATQLASDNPDPTAIANAAASMINHPNATVAARAVGVQQALERFRDNPATIAGLISSVQGLAKAVDDSGVKRLPPTAVSPLQSVTGGDLQATGLSDVSGLTNIATTELPKVGDTTTTTTTATETTGGVHPEIARIAKEYATSIGKDIKDFTVDDMSFLAERMAPWVSRDPVLLKGASLQDVLTGNYTSIPSQAGGSWVDSNGVLHVNIVGTGGTEQETTVPLADTIADKVVDTLTGLEGTTGSIVRQGISTLLSAAGEQIADLSTAFANMGLVNRNNLGVKVGEYLDSIGRRVELPSVKTARENFVNAIGNEPTYFGKLLAGINAIRDNPLVLVEAGKEILQEALPTGLAARVTKMAGIAAGAATSTVMNALESAGSTGRSVYNDEIAKGTPPAEAARRADRAAGYAAIITTATSGIMDASIAKRYGDAIESYLGRTTSSAGKEFGQESAEEFLIAVASGDSIADAITKSVVGGFVGAKASGSIDATTGLQQSLAEQGLTSSDGSFRPETIVEIQKPGGTTADTTTAGTTTAGTTTAGTTSDTTAGTTSDTTAGTTVGTVDLGTTGTGTTTTTDLGTGTTTTTDLGTGTTTTTDLGTGAGTTATDLGTGTGTTTTTDPGTGASTTTTTDPGTGASTSTTTDPGTGTSTSTTTDPGTGASTSTTTDPGTGASTSTTTDPGTGTSTQTTTDPSTNTTTTTQTNTNTGTSTSVETNASTGTTTTNETNPGAGTSTTTQTDPNTGTTTTTQVDSNTNTTTQTTVDTGTGTTTQTTTDNNTNTTTQTTTDSNTNTTTQTTTNNNTGTTTETTTDSGTGVTTETVTDPNSGVTTTTATDPNSGVTTQTVVDTNTNTTTTTETDPNSGVTTQTSTNPDTGVTTETVVDPNTGVTTSTTVDPNSNTTTTVVVDTNTNTATSSTTNIDQNVTINTTVNYGTGEVEVQVKDPGTGQIILTNVGTIPDFDIPTLVPLPSVTPLTPVKPVEPVKVPPTPQIQVGGNTIIAAEPSYPAKKSGIEETWLGGRFRQTDPLAGFRHLLPLSTPMMQEAQALSALRSASGLDTAPSRPDAGYFSYGTEPSYEEVLAPFMNGGHVQGYAAGGKILTSPLMAASGGDVPHKGSHYVQGDGGGQDDLIPAKLADGEYVFDAEIVAALGDGSNRRGAEILDRFREAIRQHKRSGSRKSIPPKAKSPLQYLKEVTK
jgi:mucin-2